MNSNCGQKLSEYLAREVKWKKKVSFGFEENGIVLDQERGIYFQLLQQSTVHYINMIEHATPVLGSWF